MAENQKCILLNMLPLELRLEIYSLVLGRDIFRLVTVPWKVTTAPDVDGNVSMTQAHFSPEINALGVHHGTSLLMTCHQIYQEAIDLLYTTNTFIVYDFSTLSTFAQSIPSQRLNSIRRLKIHYSPITSVPYVHERTRQYDLPFDLQEFWGIVVGMEGLRSLDIDLKAYHQVWSSEDECATYETERLAPLLGLRGLSTFRLQLGYISLDYSKVSYEPHAPALRELLRDHVIKRPIESEE